MYDKGHTAFVGAVGTLTTFTLVEINTLLGCLVGVMTSIYVGLGIHKRWKNRHRPDDD